jgi:hypothetical protein
MKQEQQKRVLLFLIVFSLLSISIVSAGWFGDLWNGMTNSETDVLSGNVIYNYGGNVEDYANCSVVQGEDTYEGTHRQRGFTTPEAQNNHFYCYDGRFYDCGWEYDVDSFAKKMKNNHRVGDVFCSETEGTFKWVPIDQTGDCDSWIYHPDFEDEELVEDGSNPGWIYWSNYLGKNNALGIELVGSEGVDSRFTCKDGIFYGCGMEDKHSVLAINTSFGDTLNEEYICDGSNWINIKDSPTLSVVPASCEYGSQCDIVINPISEGNHQLILEYHYINGSSETKSVFKEGNFQSIYFSEIVESDFPIKVFYITVQALTWKDNLKSKLSPPLDIRVYYSCSSECNEIGERSCAGFDYYKICEDLDSDGCFTWGEPIECGGVTYCDPLRVESNVDSKICNDYKETLTCNGRNNLFCAVNPTAANFGEVPSLSCGGVGGYKCYECTDPSHVWSPEWEICLDPSCKVTCDGISSSETVSNAVENTDAETCSSEKCYNCNKDYHPFNNTCVPDECSGVPPVLSAGMILGPNVTSSGINLSWEYSSTSTIQNPCKWNCNSTWHRNETTNTCDEGYAECTTTIGCTNESFSNTYEINGTCTDSTDVCLSCTEDYIWNGSECITCQTTCDVDAGEFCTPYGLPLNSAVSDNICCGTSNVCYTCDGDRFWNGWGCVEPSSCEGCEYETRCLREGFRLDAENLGKAYCGEDHNFKPQKELSATCQNSYECETNNCLDGECTSIISILEEQTGILDKILCKLQNLFNQEDYTTCVNNA